MRRFILLLQAIGNTYGKIRNAIKRFDARMRNHYDPARLTLVLLFIIGAVMAVLLFLPPYMGLSNDGAFDNVLADVDLMRLTPDDSTAYFSYYERTYVIEKSLNPPGTTPLLLRSIIKGAILLDVAFTGDLLFDMRFVAAIYTVMYLLLLFPLLRFLLSHVRSYSSGLFLGLIIVLVFADATVVTRFASLYTQPLEWLLLLAILDAGIICAHRLGVGLSSTLMALCCILLMTLNPYCCLAGVSFSIFFWILMLQSKSAYTRMWSIGLAMVLVFCSVVAIVGTLETQTRAAKYNQMTRGVLFEAENPELALKDFGIEPRYSVLSDTYADQAFPLVDLESGVLDDGFLDRYNTIKVLWYYIRHPLAVTNMLDNGIHSAFVLQSDYSGNYEQSVGLPPMAKALFPRIWSTFKQESAPRTVGTIIVILAVLMIINASRGKGRMSDVQERQTKLINTYFYVYVTFVFLELLTVMLMSGDSELLRESSVMGGMIDILAVWFMASLMKKSGDIEKES